MEREYAEEVVSVMTQETDQVLPFVVIATTEPQKRRFWITKQTWHSVARECHPDVLREEQNPAAFDRLLEALLALVGAESGEETGPSRERRRGRGRGRGAATVNSEPTEVHVLKTTARGAHP